MFMKIHCGYCGQAYEVYARGDLKGKARQCPHCESKIDRDTWCSAVVPAFKSAEIANIALYHDHVQDHKPLFTVSFIADHIFDERKGNDYE